MLTEHLGIYLYYTGILESSVRSDNVQMKNIYYGIISGIVLFAFLGVPTALIPTRLYKRMVQATVFDYIFLFAVPILFGIFISLYLKNKKTRKNTCVAGGGLAAGWLAVICPICTSFLVYIFGASTLLAYFDPVRPLFGMLGVIILSLMIYFQYGKGKNSN